MSGHPILDDPYLLRLLIIILRRVEPETARLAELYYQHFLARKQLHS